MDPAAERCDMVLRRAFRARRVRTTGVGGCEVRHGATSGVSLSRETSLNKHVTPRLHREYRFLTVATTHAPHTILYYTILYYTILSYTMYSIG